MMRVIILTGNEIRHQFFRKKIAEDSRFVVLASYCENVERSLESRTNAKVEASWLELQHVRARTQAEVDFFGLSNDKTNDLSNPNILRKGAINDPEVVKDIIDKKPDLIICYGSSLIRSELLEIFEGRFLNVHLGLSPYYRGSGTNVWPLINQEPDMVGATFMYIDEGIDTGQIIHQIRADIYVGDSPHSIGNRLIAKMTRVYADIIAKFDELKIEEQPHSEGKLYLMKDFDSAACEKLYDSFRNNLIQTYLINLPQKKLPRIVQNKGLQS